MVDIKALDRIIAVLSEEKEGSRNLDVRISVALGALQSESAKLLKLFVEEGYNWQIVSALLDGQVPAYSTSLDASIPGENIVGVLYSAKRRRWAAVHRAADGREVDPVWAATEALARRSVGLAALVSEARVAAKAPEEHTPDAEPPAPPVGESEPGSEEDAPEWKILF